MVLTQFFLFDGQWLNGTLSTADRSLFFEFAHYFPHSPFFKRSPIRLTYRSHP